MNEFSGFQTREFSADSVFGARAFNTDQLGRLTGITYKQVWLPEENIARCFAVSYETQIRHLTQPYMFSTVQVPLEQRENRKSHLIENCNHGFYAYYEGSNDYRNKGRINGVIEGYGITVIGTRGFRASKAKIRALHIPKSYPETMAKKVRNNYPDIPFFNSFKSMLAEFPTSGELEPTPQTDPNFWTR